MDGYIYQKHDADDPRLVTYVDSYGNVRGHAVVYYDKYGMLCREYFARLFDASDFLATLPPQHETKGEK